MESVPRGVPSVTYVRIIGSDSGTGDIITDGHNEISVLETGQPSTRHEVAQILDKNLSDEEVCEHTIGSLAGAGLGASLNPIGTFVEDSATAVIFIIGSRQARKWQFLKRTFLPFLANELYSNHLYEREQQSIGGFYQAQVTLSAFEIQSEIITDLLRPSSKGLPVSITADEGVAVQGLHKESVIDEMSLRRVLMEACENRATQALPIGGSIDTSTAVWEIELSQCERSSEDGAGAAADMRAFKSRLVVVDIPAVDSLLLGGSSGSDLRLLDGPALHKSLLAFVDCSKRLTTPARAALAPFRLSKLTQYLSELMGGNAVVVGLGIVTQGEPAVTRKTLELVNSLALAMHYPVGGKELTEILRGLLTKYRSMVLQLQDEVKTTVASKDKAPSLDTAQEKKINELQKELSAVTLECNTAKEDRLKMYEMMELLKAKYTTLATEKAAQSQELVKAEEEKLAVAKALLELKAALTSQQSQWDRDEIVYKAKLDDSKKAIDDLEAKLSAIEEERIQEKETVAQIEEQLSDARDDLAEAQATLVETQRRLADEEEKNLDLGAELLTLVNQKEFMQKNIDELQGRLDNAMIKLAASGAKMEDIDDPTAVLRAELKDKEEEVLAARRSLADTSLDLKRAQLEIERLTQEAERTYIDNKRLVDDLTKEVNSLRQSNDEMAMKYGEQQVNDPLQREMLRASSTSFLGDENHRRVQLEEERAAIKERERELERTFHEGSEKVKRQAENEVRVAERKLREVERELQRTREDLEASQEAERTLGSDLSELRQQYRGKLIQSIGITTDTDTCDAGDGPGGSSSPPIAGSPIRRPTAAIASASIAASSPTKAAANADDALQKLVTSYSESEKNLLMNLEKAKSEKTRTLKAFRELYDRYREALDALEQGIPQASHPEPMSEKLLIGNQTLDDASLFLRQSQRDEKESEREVSVWSEGGPILDQERAAIVIATYRRNLEKTEAQLAAARQEIASLHVQLRQLVVDSAAYASSSSSGGTIQVGKKGAAASNHFNALPPPSLIATTTSERRASDIEVTPETSSAKESKSRKNSNKVVSSSAAEPGSARGARNVSSSSDESEKIFTLSRQQLEAKQHIASLTEQLFASRENERRLQETIAALTVASSSSSSSSGTGSKTGGGGGGGISNAAAVGYIAKLRELERQSAQLAAKNAALEEELQSYQVYMKSTVMQHKRQIQALKLQLRNPSAQSMMVNSSSETALIASHMPVVDGGGVKLPMIIDNT